MNIVRKEWPLLLSAVVFGLIMLADYELGFMTHATSLASGRNSEIFLTSGILTVVTLAFLEGILGIDNATVLAIQVRHLKSEDAHKALTWGIWGAFIFRFFFLVAAGFILEQKWIMAIGGYYLINMAGDFFLRNLFLMILDIIVLGGMATLFYYSGVVFNILGLAIPIWIVFLPFVVFSIYRYFRERRKARDSAEESSEEGITISKFRLAHHPVLAAIIAVEWTDILFSFDSIGAGVAMTRDFWVLFWGAFFGVTCLRLFAKSFIRLLEKFPQLEAAAMLAVLVVGTKMSVEAAQGALKLHYIHIENWQTSLAILLIFTGAFFTRAKTPHIHSE
jgi:predicted tellurium resistance membrane protein TerC